MSSIMQSRAPSTRLMGSMSARLFTCVCGFEPPSLAAQKKHRRRCGEWKDRPDPRGMMLARRAETLMTPHAVLHCHICSRSVSRHAPSCPYSFSELSRAEAVERAGLDPNLFYMVMVALRQKYKGRTVLL